MTHLLTRAGILAHIFLVAGLAQDSATFVGHEKVAEGGRLAAGPDHSVTIITRTSAGQSEVHQKETDIFYVIDGSAVLVTGGKLVDAKETGPNQIRGASVEGGEVHNLTKGDVIVIPAGVPHWFKEVPRSIRYYTVKVIQP